MPSSKKKRKKRIGPYKMDEIEAVQKKPKKKKKIKLLADEPWLEDKNKETYFQDYLEKKQKPEEKLKAEKKKEPWLWKERYFQDQFEHEDEDEEKTEKKVTPKKRRMKSKTKKN